MPIKSHSWARFSKFLLTYRTRNQTFKSESKEFWGQKCWDISSDNSDLATERQRHLTTGKRAEKTKLDFRCPNWSSHLLDLRAPSSTNVPALLLNHAISKTSDPSRPTLNKIEFWAKWVEISAFFGHGNIGEGIEDGGERLLQTVPSSFVLHGSLQTNPFWFVLLNWKLYHVLYGSIEIFFLDVNNNSIPGPLYSGL